MTRFKTFVTGTRTNSFVLLVTVVVVVFGFAPVARAGFGVNEFDLAFSGVEGEPVVQAGSHPFAVSTSVRFVPVETKIEEAVKDLIAKLPTGFVGNVTAVPRCSTVDFLKAPQGDCPDAAAVGTASIELATSVGAQTFVSAVYNLEPPPGAAAKLGFYVTAVPVTVELGVSPNPPYNVVGGPTNTSQVVEVDAADLSLWGVPASPVHDPYRGKCVDVTGGSLGNCSANIPELPFLTMPRSCQGPLVSEYAADSWEHPGARLSGQLPDLSDPAWVTGSVETRDSAGNPLGLTGCGRLAFNPTTTAQPTTKAASSSTGLDFALEVKDEGITNPTGLAESDIKKAIVALPEGMTANPALAEGLNVCSEADLVRETIGSAPGEGCPNESKIGTVEVETPLLKQVLQGSLFIATPYANPFDSLLALYVVIKNPETGVLVKLYGKVEPDQTTGRLVSVFDNLPQLPFSHFKLHFREGARSPLVSPPSCGTYDTTAEFTPWAGGAPTTNTSSFQIISGNNNTPCPSGNAPPFAPEALAGTQNNSAGSYSPFYLRITRKDGEQELTRFTTNLPAGLTGNLTGIPFCPDAAIEAAKLKTGAQEENEPSCPAASQIGHTLVGAGVGPTLAWAPGQIYLADPYHGAPLSVVSITSAKVGPFDLGTVVIRFALRINPTTAQVEIDSNGSDPIPHIIKGIVVNVKEIHAYIDRQHFILNPTNCDPMSIGNTITGAGTNITSATDDTSVTDTNRFQTANCQNLDFKPSFKVSTSGKTSRKNGASLNVKLTYPKTPDAQANIRMVKVNLPKQLPSRLTTLQQACTDAQFETNPAACPAASRVGQAIATTPILPVPIAGPAYFVSHGGAKFPELILVLQGYGITIDLHGETFISKAGITSSTFHAIPDQPVTSFELTLPQGPNSALAANGNLCNITSTKIVKKKVTLRSKGRTRTITRKVKQTVPGSLVMPTVFTAQNGAVVKQSTQIEVQGCAKTKGKGKAARHGGHAKKK